MFDSLDDPELVGMLAADLDARGGMAEESEPCWLLDIDSPVVADGERVTALAGRTLRRWVSRRWPGPIQRVCVITS